VWQETSNDLKLENDRLSNAISAMQSLVTSKEADQLREREATGNKLRRGQTDQRRAASEMQRVLNADKQRAEEAMAHLHATEERLSQCEEARQLHQFEAASALAQEAEKNRQMKALLEEAVGEAARWEGRCGELEGWDTALRVEANTVRVELLNSLRSAVEIENSWSVQRYPGGEDSREAKAATQAGAYTGLYRAVERLLRTKFPLAGGNEAERQTLVESRQSYREEKSYLTITPL